jgi:glycosyltransferase involved in cell wall biosynthesis
LQSSAASGGFDVPARSLLLVAQITPPSSLVAARRVAAQCKYLGRAGYAVTVLTSVASGEGEIEGTVEVVRTKDALTSALNWRRGQFAALGGSSAEAYKPPSRLASVVVPDLSLGTWLPFGLRAARQLARAHHFDCVLTTSPPPSTHLIGLALRRRGIPWIAELRDGWTYEPPHVPWPLGVQHAADRALERRVLGRADGVVAVTRPIVDDLHKRLGLDAQLISNGYDPDEVRSRAVGSEDLLDSDRHSLVHTGRLSLSGISVRPLLDALRLARGELDGRLEVVFAGSVTEGERELLEAADIDRLVRYVGWLDRDQALGLQRAADTLLVVTEGAARRSVATGKLFEYLSSRRPILVLGEGTEAARIVQETGAGLAVPATEPEAIANALRRIVAEPLSPPQPEVANGYAYPAIVERLAAAIERVLSGRRAARP